jgi:hypothetical protein
MLALKVIFPNNGLQFAQNFIRTGLARIQGAPIPLPYGGKTRNFMVDVDPKALYAYQVSPSDISVSTAGYSLINVIREEKRREERIALTKFCRQRGDRGPSVDWRPRRRRTY